MVEGFKQEPIPKILLHRQEMIKPLPELDENVLALATDYSLETDRTLLDINHIEQIAEFIYQWWKKDAVIERQHYKGLAWVASMALFMQSLDATIFKYCVFFHH